ALPICKIQSIYRPLADLCDTPLGEQQVAILVAWARIETRVGGLPFCLEALGLREQPLCPRCLPRLVQCIGQSGALADALADLLALISMDDASLAHRHRLGDITERQMKLG